MWEATCRRSVQRRRQRPHPAPAGSVEAEPAQARPRAFSPPARPTSVGPAPARSGRRAFQRAGVGPAVQAGLQLQAWMGSVGAKARRPTGPPGGLLAAETDARGPWRRASSAKWKKRGAGVAAGGSCRSPKHERAGESRDPLWQRPRISRRRAGIQSGATRCADRHFGDAFYRARAKPLAALAGSGGWEVTAPMVLSGLGPVRYPAPPVGQAARHSRKA